MLSNIICFILKYRYIFYILSCVVGVVQWPNHVDRRFKDFSKWRPSAAFWIIKDWNF